MSDVLTPEQRRRNMQNIKSKDTQIEILLRRALRAKGYGYRKNYSKLPGTPDIVLTKYKIAIFCDGEFFHGKDMADLERRMEKNKNGEFWIKKIQKNIVHDNEVDKELRSLGWKVLRFWGNDIKKNMDDCLRTIEDAIFDCRMAE